MKITCIILLIILGLASYIAFLIIKDPEQFNSVYDVHIINGFTNNSSLALVVWCASRDGGDMGGRALQDRDDFSWSVKAKIWRTDAFNCTLKWDEKKKTFQAFLASRDSRRCSPSRQCFWVVKEDGFYFSNDNIYFVKDFSWG